MMANRTPMFDMDKYLAEQSAEILNRIRQFDNKLYLEFGESLSSITTHPGCCPTSIQM